MARLVVASTNRSGVQSKPRAKPRKRDAVATRERILNAATKEFSSRGFDGAGMERIVKAADCNIRMAYHYFQDKERLYIAVLESVYTQLRSREAELDLQHLEPLQAMKALIEFTFDHMAGHLEFISLTSSENIMRGRYLNQSSAVTKMTMPLVDALREVLSRGEEAGVFRRKVDPIQLYISIVSLSYFHISNRHTLAIIFHKDLEDKKWLRERKKHACDVVLAFLQP